MPNKHILFLMICAFLFVQPTIVFAADKPVSDCLGENEDCGEEENDSIIDDDRDKADDIIEDQSIAPGSLTLNIVKMVFALLLILAMIYLLLWFLKKRRSFDKAGALENIGGISVAQNKSVQIVRIGTTMYVLGVGENVELLKELTDEEAEQVLADRNDSPTMPAASFVQTLLQKRQGKTESNLKSEETNFNQSFQKELNKLRENRHQIMNDYKKKDDEHV